MDRGMALAGQGFAALLPLLIVIAAASPTSGQDLSAAVVDRFELTGRSAAALESAVAQPAAVRDRISVAGFLLLVLSALAFTRALQRLYVAAWRAPKLGVRGNAWGLIWLAAFSLYLSLQPVILAVLDGVVATVVSLTLSSLLWLFTPWILLARAVPWRRLLPQTLLTSIGLAGLGVASVLYMPQAVGSASAQFGVIGVAFALLSWMFGVSVVLVVAAALGATLHEAGPNRRATPRQATGRRADPRLRACGAGVRGPRPGDPVARRRAPQLVIERPAIR